MLSFLTVDSIFRDLLSPDTSASWEANFAAAQYGKFEFVIGNSEREPEAEGDCEREL
jgi:hypothetical protein